MTKKAGKALQLWLAPDDATTPLVSHLVAYVRTNGLNLNRPSTDVTTADDTYQTNLSGKPGGQANVSGVADLTNAGDIQLFDAFVDGLPRNFRMLPDSADTGDYLEGVGYVQALSVSGDVAGAWTFTATLQLTGAFDYVSA